MLAVETPRSHATIKERCEKLAAEYSSICSLVPAAHASVEGRAIPILKIGKPGANRLAAVIVGGVHGRELAPPDALMSLVEALLESYGKKAITYPAMSVREPEGGAKFSLPPVNIPLPEINTVIDRLDLYVVPLANPDGREFDIAHPAEWKTIRSGWRKNRKKRPGAPGVEAAAVEYQNGVDLNRNFPIGWKFEDYYNLADYSSKYAKPPAGKDWSGPSAGEQETFRGPEAGSEPETKNIKALVDSLAKLRLYIDVHAYGPTVLWDWGIEDNGTDPKMSFLNPEMNKKRDGLAPADPSPSGNPSYNEFVPEGEPGFRETLARLAKVMREGIDSQADPAAAKPLYQTDNCSNLYRPGNGPTTGGSDDYAFSTQVAWDAAAQKAVAGPRAPVYSYTFECGRGTEGEFHPPYKSATADPTERTFPKIEREVHFGVFAALSWLAVNRAAPPAPPPAPPAKNTTTCCPVLMSLATAPLQPLLLALREIRDEELPRTRFGRALLEPTMSTYWRVAPPLAERLRAHPSALAMTRWGLVVPLATLARGSAAAVRPIEDDELRIASLYALFALSLLLYLAAALGGLALFLQALGSAL